MIFTLSSHRDRDYTCSQVGHHGRCVENAASGQMDQALPAAWYTVSRIAWKIEFIAVPILTMAYSLFCYARVRRHVRQKYRLADSISSSLHVGDSQPSLPSSFLPSTSFIESGAASNWRGLALKLDLRLLSCMRRRVSNPGSNLRKHIAHSTGDPPSGCAPCCQYGAQQNHFNPGLL